MNPRLSDCKDHTYSWPLLFSFNPHLHVGKLRPREEKGLPKSHSKVVVELEAELRPPDLLAECFRQCPVTLGLVSVRRGHLSISLRSIAGVRGRLSPAAQKEGSRWGRRYRVRLCPDHISYKGWVGKAGRRGMGKRKRRQTCTENLLVPGGVTCFI